MTTWAVILAVGLGSYLLRALPLALGARWLESPAVERTMGHAGTAALAALVAAGLRRDAADVADGLALLAAAAAALVVAMRGGALVRVLVAGALAHAAVLGVIWLVP